MRSKETQTETFAYADDGTVRFKTVGIDDPLIGECPTGSKACAFADSIDRFIGIEHGVHDGCKGERGIEGMVRFEEWVDATYRLFR